MIDQYERSSSCEEQLPKTMDLGGVLGSAARWGKPKSEQPADFHRLKPHTAAPSLVPKRARRSITRLIVACVHVELHYRGVIRIVLYESVP